MMISPPSPITGGHCLDEEGSGVACISGNKELIAVYM